MSNTSVKTITSLQRGLMVLQLLQTRGALSLHEIHLQTDLPKASLMRIVKTLLGSGMVWQRLIDKRYIAAWARLDPSAIPGWEARLVELASPLLARLSDEVQWPSVLAVPRETAMEVIETNAPRSAVPHIPLGPLGFRINMLMSATGRAYIAFCPPAERVRILQALTLTQRAGDMMASAPAWVEQIIARTQQQGYGLRDQEFGGDYDVQRREKDDGRDSLALPLLLGGAAVASINLTWTRKALGRKEALNRFLGPMRITTETISQDLARSLRI